MKPSTEAIEGVFVTTASRDGCRIVREHDVVYKIGKKVRTEEANALIYAGELGLPVPVVHDVSKNPEGVWGIRMDYIEGMCLEDAWPCLLDDQKLSIAKQLRRIISDMRASSASSPVLIGSCGGPAHDCRSIKYFTGGPFERESDFNEFVLNLRKGTPQVIRSTLADHLRKHNGQRVVFSHADLSPRNIIVSGDKIQALLDWEFAGWYPEYWEYVKFFNSPTSCEGWYDLAPEIFEKPYPSELLTYQALARWQRL